MDEPDFIIGEVLHADFSPSDHVTITVKLPVDTRVGRYVRVGLGALPAWRAGDGPGLVGGYCYLHGARPPCPMCAAVGVQSDLTAGTVTGDGPAQHRSAP